MDDILEPMSTNVEIPKSRVYISVGKNNRIERIEGEYSLPADLTDWILIDEGYGDKYNLAQSHYLENPLIAEDGTHNYIYSDGEIIEASEEEKAEELKTIIRNTPKSIEEQIAELYETDAELLYELASLELGLIEI